jgi:predicted nuclease with TOPRIM domain
MNTIESTPTQVAAQQTLVSAVAHHIEQMSKDELETLAAKALGDLQAENAALRKRIQQLEQDKAKLEADNERLLYKISRSLFDEKDYENFDTNDYSVPVEEMLANARKRLHQS